MSPIFFQNAQGERMAVDPSMTIEDLVRQGVTSIRLFREGEPLEPGWWRDVKKLSGKQPKTDATRKVAKKKEKK